MRLWHKDLIPVLPRQQLLGQWRELCAIAKSIAEKGTPNHVLVNQIMEYPMFHFIIYIVLIKEEMVKRGYKPDIGRFEPFFNTEDYETAGNVLAATMNIQHKVFQNWHNDRYLAQCLANLQEKYDCGAIPVEEWKKIADRYPEWK